jgi:hypothetical protein
MNGSNAIMVLVVIVNIIILITGIIEQLVFKELAKNHIRFQNFQVRVSHAEVQEERQDKLKKC